MKTAVNKNTDRTYIHCTLTDEKETEKRTAKRKLGGNLTKSQHTHTHKSKQNTNTHTLLAITAHADILDSHSEQENVTIFKLPCDFKNRTGALN